MFLWSEWQQDFAGVRYYVPSGRRPSRWDQRLVAFRMQLLCGCQTSAIQVSYKRRSPARSRPAILATLSSVHGFAKALNQEKDFLNKNRDALSCVAVSVSRWLRLDSLTSCEHPASEPFLCSSWILGLLALDRVQRFLSKTYTFCVSFMRRCQR